MPPQPCITKDNIGRGGRHSLLPDRRSRKGLVRRQRLWLRLHRNWHRRPCEARWAKSIWTRTFEEREKINAEIVVAVDKASVPWGIKVTRYEIKKHRAAGQASRTRWKNRCGRAREETGADRGESEGDKQAKINRAEGEKQEAIAKSEGEKMKRINEAEGRARRSAGWPWRPPRESAKSPAPSTNGGHECGQSAHRRAVPRRVRQAGQDEQHDDHPLEPGGHPRASSNRPPRSSVRWSKRRRCREETASEASSRS